MVSGKEKSANWSNFLTEMKMCPLSSAREEFPTKQQTAEWQIYVHYPTCTNGELLPKSLLCRFCRIELCGL